MPSSPSSRKLVVKKDLTATRVLRQIRALGYAGGYVVLKQYVRSIRRRSRRRPHLRFETDKEKQAQVDLSDSTVDFHGQATAVMCFSMVFGYSRWQFLRFTKTANAHSVCHSHVLAFEEAGGTPQEILWDRRKQVLLESYARRVVFHPLFAALVKHYGFEPIPLAPGHKERKGKVENPFKYVDSDFVKGTTFHDLDDLNRRLRPPPTVAFIKPISARSSGLRITTSKSNASLDRKTILDLAELGFLDRCESVFSSALPASARPICRSALECELAPPVTGSATSAPTTCSRHCWPPSLMTRLRTGWRSTAVPTC
jgi:transposase